MIDLIILVHCFYPAVYSLRLACRYCFSYIICKNYKLKTKKWLDAHSFMYILNFEFCLFNSISSVMCLCS